MVRPGGPRFLVVFGCGVQLLLGAVLIVTGGTIGALTGDGGAIALLACLLWIGAVTTLYFVCANSPHSQRVAVIAAAAALVGGLPLGAGWIFWWLFSAGFVALGAVISARSPHG